MASKVSCARCGKELEGLNGILIEGHQFGLSCARDIRNLLKLRRTNKQLQHLCNSSYCTTCNLTFCCPIKSSLEGHLIKTQLDL